VRVERDRREAADAAWNQAERGAEQHLPETCLAKTREELAVRLDVQGFNHHHHHNHEPSDEDAVAEDVYESVEKHSEWRLFT